MTMHYERTPRFTRLKHDFLVVAVKCWFWRVVGRAQSPISNLAQRHLCLSGLCYINGVRRELYPTILYRGFQLGPWYTSPIQMTDELLSAFLHRFTRGHD